jgi:hypothetical protein
VASRSFVSSKARHECAGRDAGCSDTSLTFLPQQGASGFFADHFGGGMKADGVFWSGSEELQQLARTMADAW